MSTKGALRVACADWSPVSDFVARLPKPAAPPPAGRAGSAGTIEAGDMSGHHCRTHPGLNLSDASGGGQGSALARDPPCQPETLGDVGIPYGIRPAPDQPTVRSDKRLCLLRLLGFAAPREAEPDQAGADQCQRRRLWNRCCRRSYAETILERVGDRAGARKTTRGGQRAVERKRACIGAESRKVRQERR